MPWSAQQMRELRKKRKDQGLCPECGGQRETKLLMCKKCRDAKSATSRKHWDRMIVTNSKQHDKERGRMFQESEYITREFLKECRRKQNNLCGMCGTTMQTANRQASDGLTVQRLDNSIAHVKTNCILACYHCNVSEYNTGQFRKNSK